MVQKKRKDKIVVFTRYPELGTTKTRLIPHLGAEGAAELQRQMSVHMLMNMRRCNDADFGSSYGPNKYSSDYRP